eukprot:11873668-Ditylum_brightwellii.AAC.1
MSRCITSQCECRKAGRECMSCFARKCCIKQNNGSASLSGNDANGRHLHSRAGTAATAANSNLNLKSSQAPPALEESDCSDFEGDSAPCRVLEDPLYQLDNLTKVDKKLVEVYGDTVHLNDGAHLDGGVPDNKAWQQ